MQNLEFRRVTNFFNLNEPVFKRREKPVALNFAFDKRKIEVGTARQHLLINLRAAANENFGWEVRRIQFFQRVKNQNVRLLVLVGFCEIKFELIGFLKSALPRHS